MTSEQWTILHRDVQNRLGDSKACTGAGFNGVKLTSLCLWQAQLLAQKAKQMHVNVAPGTASSPL